MNAIATGGILLLLIMATSPAQSQDTDSCRACCKEVYGTCKEGHLAGCDARYDKCLEKCLEKDKTKAGKSLPKKGEPPTTIIPEIPDNKKMDELKKQQ